MRTLLSALLLAWATASVAQGSQVTSPESARAMVESQCADCHARWVKGEAQALYTRTERRVHKAEELAKQIHACGSQLKTPLFPEEEAHLATYLNSKYYFLKQ